MVARDKPALVTAEDLLTMPEGPGRRELVRGEIIEMSPSGKDHGKLSFHVGFLIGSRSDALTRGYLTVEGAGYILSQDPDTVRAPDIGYITRERAAGQAPGGYFPAAPDLAVEIASPNDTATEIQQKVLEYLAAGTRLVLVLYPQLRVVAVHSTGGSRTLDINGVLDGGDVLPGLSLQVRDIFAVLDEKPTDDDGNA